MPSDAIALALIQQLCREGVIGADDIGAIADCLDAQSLSDEAHAVRCQLLHASAPTQSEWEAERNRDRFHVIEGRKDDA